MDGDRPRHIRPDPECGEPGGGRGRRDEVGGSGVYPASAGTAPGDAVVRSQAEWGQGDRGAAGYQDAGSSEIFYYPVQLEAAAAAESPPPADGPEPPGSAVPPASTEPSEPPWETEPAERENEAAAQRRVRWGGW